MGSPSVYLEDLIKKLSRLPGIGPKSASRIAFHILSMKISDVDALAEAMREIKRRIRDCSVCGGISDAETCPVCLDPSRDRRLICVVAEPRDMLTLETTGSFHGVYHVLHGLISPLDGIGPDDIHIASLIKRATDYGASEVILALNPTIEGDATTLYIARELSGTGVRVTRIARGLPVGADLEFADRATIIKSIEGRSAI